MMQKYLCWLVSILLAFFYLPEVIYSIPAHESWLAVARGWAVAIVLLIGSYFVIRHLWQRAQNLNHRGDVYEWIAKGLAGALFMWFILFAQRVWLVAPEQTIVSQDYRIAWHQSDSKGGLFHGYFLYINECPDPYHHYDSNPKPLHFAINSGTAKMLDSQYAPVRITVTHRGRIFFGYQTDDAENIHQTSCPIQ